MHLFYCLIIFSNSTSTFNKITKPKIYYYFVRLINIFIASLSCCFRIYFTSIQWSIVKFFLLGCSNCLLEIVLTFLISVLNYQKVETYFLKSLNYKLILLFFSVGVSIFVLSDAKNVVEYEDSKLYDYSINLENYTANLDGQLCHVDKNNNINSINKICSFNSGAEQKDNIIRRFSIKRVGIFTIKIQQIIISKSSQAIVVYLFLAKKYINEISKCN